MLVWCCLENWKERHHLETWAKKVSIKIYLREKSGRMRGRLLDLTGSGQGLVEA
jgi:hypothetical protein